MTYPDELLKIFTVTSLVAITINDKFKGEEFTTNDIYDYIYNYNKPTIINTRSALTRFYQNNKLTRDGKRDILFKSVVETVPISDSDVIMSMVYDKIRKSGSQDLYIFKQSRFMTLSRIKLAIEKLLEHKLIFKRDGLFYPNKQIV